MKVLYVQTVAERIVEAMTEASSSNRVISKVLLSDDEWNELCRLEGILPMSASIKFGNAIVMREVLHDVQEKASREKQ